MFRQDTITSKGGDPAMDVAGADDASKESEIQELRTEMASAEERLGMGPETESIRKLRASLSEDAERCSQDVASLNNALDGARSELERNMAKAAEVQRDEAAQLEAQVQAERQRIDREETEEASAAERAARLKGTLMELRERPRRAPTLQDDNTKLVTEQLRKIRDEVASVEVQCQASQDEVHRLERQRLATEAEGAREAQQVKAKIQEIWRSLAAATAGEKSQVIQLRPLRLSVPRQRRRKLLLRFIRPPATRRMRKHSRTEGMEDGPPPAKVPRVTRPVIWKPRSLNLQPTQAAQAAQVPSTRGIYQRADAMRMKPKVEPEETAEESTVPYQEAEAEQPREETSARANGVEEGAWHTDGGRPEQTWDEGAWHANGAQPEQTWDDATWSKSTAQPEQTWEGSTWPENGESQHWHGWQPSHSQPSQPSASRRPS
eukprot:s5123_g3.t1